MSEQTSESYEFGRFRVKSDERALRRGEELVSLTPKAFEILLALLENDGRIVPKDDLMKKVWPNTFVEEGNLTQNVSLLRKALGESANGPQFIETVPRRGYRFVAPVFKTKADNGHEVVNPPTPAAAVNFQATPPAKLATRNSKLGVALTLAVALAIVAGIVYLSSRNKAGAAPTAI